MKTVKEYGTSYSLNEEKIVPDDLAREKIAFLLRHKFIHDLNILGEALSQLKNANEKFPKGALTNLLLTRLAPLVGKEVTELKKVAFLNFVPHETANKTVLQNVMFKDVSNPRHGDQTHLIQLYLMKKMLKFLKLADNKQQDFFKYVIENSAEDSTSSFIKNV